MIGVLSQSAHSGGFLGYSMFVAYTHFITLDLANCYPSPGCNPTVKSNFNTDMTAPIIQVRIISRRFGGSAKSRLARSVIRTRSSIPANSMLVISITLVVHQSIWHKLGSIPSGAVGHLESTFTCSSHQAIL